MISHYINTKNNGLSALFYYVATYSYQSGSVFNKSVVTFLLVHPRMTSEWPTLNEV